MSVEREALLSDGYAEPHPGIFRDKGGKHIVIVDGQAKSLAYLNRAQLGKLGIDVDVAREIIRSEISAKQTTIPVAGRPGKDAERARDEPETPKVAEIVPAEREWTAHELASPSIVAPIVPVEQVVDAFRKFQEIKDRIWSEEDYITVGNKRVPTKSAWRKAMVPFNLNTEILKEERVDLMLGDYEVRFTVRALAPNGRFADNIGSCNTLEDYADRQRRGMAARMKMAAEDLKPEALSHFIRSMALTRAISRAVSDLVGGGGSIVEDEGE